MLKCKYKIFKQESKEDEMEIIRITPHMIDQDASPVLERIIADAPDDATLSFEKGVYPLSVTVNVKGKKGDKTNA